MNTSAISPNDTNIGISANILPTLADAPPYLPPIFLEPTLEDFKVQYPVIYEVSTLHILTNGCLTISTMTLTCDFNTMFHIENIAKYLLLDINAIYGVKYRNRDGSEIIRSLVYKKLKNSEKKKKKDFSNQITIYVRTTSKTEPINVKLFKNGALQITGCKCITEFRQAILVICKCLIKTQLVFDTNIRHKNIDRTNIEYLDLEYKSVQTVSFVSNPEELVHNKLNNFSIKMINTNYSLNFVLDRTKIYQIINKSMEVSPVLGVETKVIDPNIVIVVYDPQTHAGVNIKYRIVETGHVLSIFCFEEGNIIIAGAKNALQILKGFYFVQKFVRDHYSSIIDIDINEKNRIMLEVLNENLNQKRQLTI